MTKEERAAYMKKYQQEHKEEIRQNLDRWKKKNPEKVAEHKRKYYQAHKKDTKYKATRAECYKRWYAKNREKVAAYQRERYKRKILAEIQEGRQ